MARQPTPAGGTDAVRRSLDSHAVDAESEDRSYLVAMLRRLGYTDAQVQDYLSGRAEPGAPALAAQQEDAVEAAPAAARAPDRHAHVVPDAGERRDVEVEYTGPGLQDYRFVDPVDFFGDDSALVEFQSEAAPEPAQEWPAADDAGAAAEPLAEFVPAEPEPAWEPEPAEPEPDTAWAAEPQPEEPAEAPALAWAEPQAEPDQTIHYGDYTLYQKEELREGQPARVFAFSKVPPGEGYEPATELPEGYQVAENPESGRPFLRRAGEEDWSLAEAAGVALPGPAGGEPGRRRVRLKRVRAANREEAMRLVEREGGNPLASVPIDIEKRLGDQ